MRTHRRLLDLSRGCLAGAKDEAGDFGSRACAEETPGQRNHTAAGFETSATILTVVWLGREFLAGDELAGHDADVCSHRRIEIESE